MRKIPAAGVTWRMGQPYPNGENCSSGSGAGNTKADILDNETGHMVRLTNDYYAAVYMMTQLQYSRLTGSWTSASYEAVPLPDRYVTPVFGNNNMAPLSYNALRGTPDSSFKGWPEAGHAVKADSVLKTIRDFTGVSGLDLPTEAEWEYACRAGTETSLNSGKNVSDPLSERADANMAEVGYMQYNAPKLKAPEPVGLRKPNAWGLYDCHGNVGEMCLDWYATGTVYRATFVSGWETGTATVAPVGSANTDGAITTRITRGGDWFYGSSWARSASRRLAATPTMGTYHNGFRLFCRADFEKAQ